MQSLAPFPFPFPFPPSFPSDDRSSLASTTALSSFAWFSRWRANAAGDSQATPVCERRAHTSSQRATGSSGMPIETPRGTHMVSVSGVGEGVDDLEPFDARAFADRLLAG